MTITSSSWATPAIFNIDGLQTFDRLARFSYYVYPAKIMPRRASLFPGIEQQQMMDYCDLYL